MKELKAIKKNSGTKLPAKDQLENYKLKYGIFHFFNSIAIIIMTRRVQANSLNKYWHHSILLAMLYDIQSFIR